MKTTDIHDAMRGASCKVLETMFFSDATALGNASILHQEPVTCLLHCSGAEEGTFSVAVDHHALHLLGCAFYGEDQLSLQQEQELICELANMLAGSTLSAIAPTHYCELSSPQLCSWERHNQIAHATGSGIQSASVQLQIDGGLLSLCCHLRSAA